MMRKCEPGETRDSFDDKWCYEPVTDDDNSEDGDGDGDADSGDDPIVLLEVPGRSQTLQEKRSPQLRNLHSMKTIKLMTEQADAVCRIKTGTCFATCTMVRIPLGKDGELCGLMTNRHVLNSVQIHGQWSIEFKSLRANNDSYLRYRVGERPWSVFESVFDWTYLFSSEHLDCSFIAVSQTFARRMAHDGVIFLETSFATLHQRIYVVHYPRSGDVSFSHGEVTKMPVGISADLGHNAVTEIGSSGSPLMNEDGAIVALVKSLGFASPMQQIIPAIQHNFSRCESRHYVPVYWTRSAFARKVAANEPLGMLMNPIVTNKASAGRPTYGYIPSVACLGPPTLKFGAGGLHNPVSTTRMDTTRPIKQITHAEYNHQLEAPGPSTSVGVPFIPSWFSRYCPSSTGDVTQDFSQKPIVKHLPSVTTPSRPVFANNDYTGSARVTRDNDFENCLETMKRDNAHLLLKPIIVDHIQEQSLQDKEATMQ